MYKAEREPLVNHSKVHKVYSQNMISTNNPTLVLVPIDLSGPSTKKSKKKKKADEKEERNRLTIEAREQAAENKEASARQERQEIQAKVSLQKKEDSLAVQKKALEATQAKLDHQMALVVAQNEELRKQANTEQINAKRYRVSVESTTDNHQLAQVNKVMSNTH